MANEPCSAGGPKIRCSPSKIEKPAPATKIPTAARKDQKKRSLP